MTFKLVAHEIQDDLELDMETLNFDTMPDMLRVLADKIADAQKQGCAYDSVDHDANEIAEDNLICVFYFVNSDSGEEHQFELGV